MSALCALPSQPAHGCAACASGDATLTVAGAEQPFAGRLRTALEFRYRTDVVGREQVDRASIREWRAGISTAWAPHADLFLIADVPLLHRQVKDVTLAENTAWGLGELSLSGKYFVFRDRELAPRYLVALLGGLKLPTAAWHKDSTGNYLPLEAQPGTGSLDLTFGASLALFHDELSGYASLQWLEPVLARSALEPGRAWNASAAAQYQLTRHFAPRLVAELRVQQPNQETGEPDPNSGGSITFVGLDLLVSPVTDFAAVFGVRVPALNRLRGAHEEGPVFSTALVQDW